jgi:hypothetical protein
VTQAGATPGLGLGWTRLAAKVAEQIPAADIARIWLFLPVRRSEREWGTAVIARRVGAGRFRVYTGRYMLVARGRARGEGRLLVEEVGESPEEVVAEVIRGVQDRAGEAEPPIEIEPTLWYPEHDEPAAEG